MVEYESSQWLTPQLCLEQLERWSCHLLRWGRLRGNIQLGEKSRVWFGACRLKGEKYVREKASMSSRR